MKILIYGIQKIQIPVISKTSLRQKEFNVIKKKISKHIIFFLQVYIKKNYT